MNLCLYLAARSVSVCFHHRMLALILRLDFPVSGGPVEVDDHARTLEDGVFLCPSFLAPFFDLSAHMTPCPINECHAVQQVRVCII